MSIIWTSIFGIGCLEWLVVCGLVVPLPRSLRRVLATLCGNNWPSMGDTLRKPLTYLGVALSLALVESIVTRQRLVARRQLWEGGEASSLSSGDPYHHHHHVHSHDKERQFRAERNMYLAGFTLTLLFVIGRITTLMQESVELEEEVERLQKQTSSDSKKKKA